MHPTWVVAVCVVAATAAFAYKQVATNNVYAGTQAPVNVCPLTFLRHSAKLFNATLQPTAASSTDVTKQFKQRFAGIMADTPLTD